MSDNQALEEKKCLVLHLPVSLVEKINKHKEKTGKSKNAVLIDLIIKGLELS